MRMFWNGNDDHLDPPDVKEIHVCDECGAEMVERCNGKFLESYWICEDCEGNDDRE